MSNLRDALLKAGLKNKKSENERKFKPTKKEVTKTEKHQQARDFCEVCETTQPDVEKFKHKNYSIDADWLCVNCADINQIHDECRLTMQSRFSVDGKYMRRYGPTVVFEGQKDMRKAPKGPKAQQSVNKKQTPKFSIDDDGEKNFNC